MSEEPINSEKTLPPSPNPAQMAQMVTTAMSGNPDAALDVMVAAGAISPEQVEQLKAEARSEQLKFAEFAAQIAQNTDGVRLMAHAMDNWRDGVRSDILRVQRSVELIRRVLAKLPAFKETYERLEAEDDEREEVAKRSIGSEKVATSKVQPKVA